MKLSASLLLLITICASCCADRETTVGVDLSASTYLPYSEGNMVVFQSSSGLDTLRILKNNFGQDRDKTKGECCCAYYDTRTVSLQLDGWPNSKISLALGQFDGVQVKVSYRDSSFSDRIFNTTGGYFSEATGNAFLQEYQVGDSIYHDVLKFHPSQKNSPQITTVLVAANTGVIRVISSNGDTLDLH